jgi:hypothetical protein
VPRDAARRDRHRVEPDVAFGLLGMRGEPGASRRRDPVLLSRKKRFGGAIERAARLHLDENQHATAARDNVHFADRASKAPRHEAVAFGDEIGGGAAFRREPDEVGGDTLGPGLARRHFWITPSCHHLH